ncbi:integrase domain-containing protein [Massilia sp. YIM B04103]|uniref:integrase domain-containing protein n=1 Tax=Massilia sp. YIM B04103 TaxID=2963106 RepID=UPI00210D1EA7|nr:integrase domain-containing protein [Massilia sp. YIM B04103]
MRVKKSEYWKAQLGSIIDRHNDVHASRSKIISYNTRQARRQGLFRIFVLLRQLGYRPKPKNLSERHIRALLAYWTAQPAPDACQPALVNHAPRLNAPFSAAYIQQQLSFLRVFAGWIGKAGLVREASFYGVDPALVARTYTAQSDKSWAGNGVDAGAVLEQVRRIDVHVAAQLCLMIAFGLRRKEAVMFSPAAAEVPADALPTNHPAGERYVCFLQIKRGTKGGHLRYAAVRTEAQREALELARQLAPEPDDHIGRPGLSLKQSLDLFSNVVRQVGLTKKELGVTPHGLRHQFAGDLYFDIAQLKAPVQGGEMDADPHALKEAYRQVAEQLGHHRPQISNAYLGSPRKAPRASAAQRTPEAP